MNLEFGQSNRVGASVDDGSGGVDKHSVKLRPHKFTHGFILEDS